MNRPRMLTLLSPSRGFGHLSLLLIASMLNSSTIVDAGVCGVDINLRGRPGFHFSDPVGAGVLVVPFFGRPLPLFTDLPVVLAAVVPGVRFMLTTGVARVPVLCSTICTSSSSSALLS